MKPAHLGYKAVLFVEDTLSPPSGVCLDPELADAYARGALTQGERDQVLGHLDGCERCRRLCSELLGLEAPRAELPLEPGAVVLERFRIDRLLGRGGMGAVYEAWHLQLQRRFALKVMLPSLRSDAQMAQRFLREARAAARLSSPHIGRVHDFGSLPDGSPFMVMEYLEGETLEAALARGALPLEDALRLFRQALEALAEAHEAGIVHRDFKPANLFLARNEEGRVSVKVLDFGIAKSVNPELEHGLGATTGLALVGSPVFMAPEQLLPGAPIDARCDVWAAGCVLYQALTGSPPFVRGSLTELARAIQTEPHRPLAQVRPEAPNALSELIDLCLEKDAAKRFAAAPELLVALDEAMAQPDGRPRRRRYAPLFAGALVLAACAAAWIAIRSTPQHPPVAAPVVATPAPTEPPLPAGAPPPVLQPAPAPEPGLTPPRPERPARRRAGAKPVQPAPQPAPSEDELLRDRR